MPHHSRTSLPYPQQLLEEILTGGHVAQPGTRQLQRTWLWIRSCVPEQPWGQLKVLTHGMPAWDERMKLVPGAD